MFILKTDTGEPDGSERNYDLSPTWYTLEDLMAMFKRGLSTINRWRRNHNLVCFDLEGTVLVNGRDLEKFLHENRKVKKNGKFVPPNSSLPTHLIFMALQFIGL